MGVGGIICQIQCQIVTENTLHASKYKLSTKKQSQKSKENITPQPLYNKVRYNTVLDITRISVGTQLVILDLFSYIAIHFTLVITQFG